MKKTIHKYPVQRNQQFFSMILPRGFKFLRLGFQNNALFMWCEVDNQAVKDETNFAIYGTGQDIPINANYLTTYDEGPFVLHLYRI